MVSNKVVIISTAIIAVVLLVVFSPVYAPSMAVELNKLKPKPDLPDNCHYTGEYTYKGDPAFTCN